MNNYEAIREIVWQGYRRRSSKSSAARAYRSAKQLGLTDEEAYDLLCRMEYHEKIIRLVPQLAAVHPLETPEMTGAVS